MLKFWFDTTKGQWYPLQEYPYELTICWVLGTLFTLLRENYALYWRFIL